MRALGGVVMRIRTFSSLALSVTVAGCSIHPLPDDVGPASTYDIVRNLRCEAKAEVGRRIVKLLNRSPSPLVRDLASAPSKILDQKKLELLDIEYEKKQEFTFNGREQKYTNLGVLFRAFKAAGISYEFEFSITENNDAVGRTDLRFPFTNGLFTFGFGGSVKKTRLGKRTFKMVENFGDLRKLKCGRGVDENMNKRSVLREEGDFYESTLRKKFIYPLTGSIGMDKIMGDFLSLSGLPGGKGTMTDTIKFTTNLAADFDAKVTLNPGPLKRFRFASASANLDAKREDIHQVIITLAFPNLGAVKAALNQEKKFKDKNEQRVRDGLHPIPEKHLSEVSALEKVAALAKYEAALAQCIETGEAREDARNALRDMPPEYYCIEYAKVLVQLSEKRNFRPSRGVNNSGGNGGQESNSIQQNYN